ncbi:3-keto-5-aminohexanoate cleavage enzyme [Candidatus Magnetomoraceae bacterium gMMP-1]
MYDPLIITCAIVGAELTKEKYPYLPITPEEIAEAAREAVEAGATIIHLHVRDEEGKPTQRVDIFKKVTEKIQKRCNCIIQYSAGGAVGDSVEERCAPLSLKPEMASLSMGSINFGKELFENTKDTIIKISQAIQKNRVMPELAIFDYGMMDTVVRYLKKGYLPKKFHIGFALGMPGGMGGDIKNLVLLRDCLKPDQTWTVEGMGKFQLPLAVHAIAMGGHIRVGIEDNIYFRKGELVKSNTQLVERVVRIAREMDRPIANVKQARKILRIN